MGEAHMTILVNDAIQGHTSQLEEIDFLAIHPRNVVTGIGQANERHLLIRPILLERHR